MNAEEIEQLRRRMGEVAALPHEDAKRLAVVRQISQVEGPLEQEWLELLREDERMRLELARVTPPPDLEQRLLAIPQQIKPRTRWLLRTSRWVSALAAVLVIGLALWGVTAMKNHRLSRTLGDIATLAMASHETQPDLAVASSDWQVVRTALDGSLYFPIDRPKLDPSFKLLGGKVVKLAGASMVYTRWESAGRTYSLYQFCGKDFGINAPVARQEISPRPSPKARCNVIVWTEDHCDYALVIDGETTPAWASGA